MITTTEAARQSKRTPETIRRWLRSGKLKGRKVAAGYWLIYTFDDAVRHDYG